MTYAIVLIDNADLVADYESLTDARAALREYVTENPAVRERVALVAFDLCGWPAAHGEPTVG
jgi:hypothetical protein